MGTSLIMNILLDIFRNNNLIIHKFLLNFTIFMCVIEDYMKSNNLISKTISKKITMFDVINASHFDIIAFCEINKCYTEVCKLVKVKSKDNFKVYKNNNKLNNFENNQKKKLFSSIELSSLTFKPPE